VDKPSCGAGSVGGFNPLDDVRMNRYAAAGGLMALKKTHFIQTSR
jgi:hypothetical protein